MLSRVKYILEKNSAVASIARFIYRRTVLKYEHHKQNRNFLKYAIETMELIDAIFKELNIHFWLEYGTLLGAVREKGLIKHDLDIDLGLFLSDYSPKIEEVFNRYGFKKIRKISIDNDSYGLEESYVYRDITIDLFYFTKKENSLYSHGFKNEDGKSWAKTIEDRGGLIVRELYFPYSGFRKIEFLGKEFNIPKDYDAHLKAFYGENYMTPNSKWNPYTMATNVKELQDKIGKVYEY